MKGRFDCSFVRGNHKTRNTTTISPKWWM